MFVCPLVTNKLKTAEPIEPKFCVIPQMTLGKVRCLKLQNLCPKVIKNVIKAPKFFVIVSYCTKRRCSQIKQPFEIN